MIVLSFGVHTLLSSMFPIDHLHLILSFSPHGLPYHHNLYVCYYFFIPHTGCPHSANMNLHHCHCSSGKANFRTLFNEFEPQLWKYTAAVLRPVKQTHLRTYKRRLDFFFNNWNLQFNNLSSHQYDKFMVCRPKMLIYVCITNHLSC